MKKTALFKDIQREIKKSMGRFISIFAIVAIGVAFFAGVKASVPIMKNSADSYFDDYNLMDIKVMSTMGMTKEDVEALREIDGVEGIYPSYTLDTLSKENNSERVMKVLSIPMMAKQDDVNYMNQARLVNGRMPQAEDECVIEHAGIGGVQSKIGDTITLTSGTDTDINESLKNTTYKIVGEVTTPYYLSFEKGSASIGSGKVDNFIMIADSNFKMDVYTEVYMSVKGAKAMNSYGEAYFDHIDTISEKVKELSTQRADLRLDEIKSEAQKSIDEGRNTYTENLNKFNAEMKKAKDELATSKKTLTQSQLKLDKEYTQSTQTILDKEQVLTETENTLAKSRQDYQKEKDVFDQQKALFDSKLPEIQGQIATLKQQQTTLSTQVSTIDDQLLGNLSDVQREELEAQKQTIVQSLTIVNTSLQGAQDQVNQQQEALTNAQIQLETAKQQIDGGYQQLESGKQQLDAGKKEAEVKFAEAQQQIDDGLKKLKSGEETLTKEEREGSAKLEEAKEKLDQSEKKLTDLEKPTWYVLDRHSHYSFMDYGSAADRMGAIAQVFPLFFFLVAALVCLTTMTRMVDEQRQEIGTLKALGYKKSHIAMKYVIYAGVASICGGIFGAIVGMIVFPMVIYNAWGIMYVLPDVKLQFQIGLGVLAVVLATSITILASISAVYKELIETPSLLMRPKAPKNGKKIFLERIPWIWKHFNFIHKVTARNIFRYKKRFLMTVIGISGCTALLVAGFGIRDSIGQIAQKQYGDVYKFNVSLGYTKDAEVNEKEEALIDFIADERIENAVGIALYHGSYEDGGEDQLIDIYIPDDLASFENFIDLRNRSSGKQLKLSDEGAIITEKLANMKNLSVGDNITIDNGDDIKAEVVISGITENYVGHALYMTPTYYKSLYRETAKDTGILGILKDTSKDNESKFGNEIMTNDTYESVTFYSGIASSFEDTIASLSIVVLVLIISAGLLAFVVLYNLTNVNISERLREIATIKVLGFYDKEVSAYVYRENIVLTLIGAFAGLLLGIGLHSLIMSIAEMDNVMFGRNINMLSFILSLIITMGFAIIVNLVMYKKLRNIPMVESLKSVE